jgi:hypothetical protein
VDALVRAIAASILLLEINLIDFAAWQEDSGARGGREQKVQSGLSMRASATCREAL